MYLCGDTASLRENPNGSVRNAYTEEGLSVDVFLKQLDQVNKDHPPQPEKAKEEYLQYLRDRVGVDGYTQEEYDRWPPASRSMPLTPAIPPPIPAENDRKYKLGAIYG